MGPQKIDHAHSHMVDNLTTFVAVCPLTTWTSLTKKLKRDIEYISERLEKAVIEKAVFLQKKLPR